MNFSHPRRVVVLILAGLLFLVALPAFAESAVPDFSDRSYALPIDFSGGPEPSAEHLSEGVYEDSTIRVAITDDRWENCRFWAADIVISDPSQLRTVSACQDFSNNRKVMDPVKLAQHVNAIVALNGDSWGAGEKKGLGIILRQGRLIAAKLDERDKPNHHLMDILLIDEDGDFHGIHVPAEGELDISTWEGKRLLNVLSFGPILVENGEPISDFQGADRWMDMARDVGRQRVCIAQVEPLHYKIICCAGPVRGSRGMTLEQFARLAAEQGVQTAYNLDGGDSTMLYFFGSKKVNKSGTSNVRSLWDIIYFVSAEGQ
ncbi:MAG: phosphodiester glycosidase family protein [Clostridia bacterium]|nr:phosphodiester glycosidase family protein [Clostridia bacterium]